MTDPDQAAEFVKETQVDALAVTIGNVHGKYRSEPKLDFKRL
jgi:tagatose 1,6-diphosphate aldolase GatY/KbaY